MRKMMLTDASHLEWWLKDLEKEKADWCDYEKGQHFVLSAILKQLQSPGEMIKEAFEAGKKLRYYELGANYRDNTDTPLTAGDYLKQKGYDDTL